MTQVPIKNISFSYNISYTTYTNSSQCLVDKWIIYYKLNPDKFLSIVDWCTKPKVTVAQSYNHISIILSHYVINYKQNIIYFTDKWQTLCYLTD